MEVHVANESWLDWLAIAWTEMEMHRAVIEWLLHIVTMDWWTVANRPSEEENRGDRNQKDSEMAIVHHWDQYVHSESLQEKDHLAKHPVEMGRLLDKL